MAGLIVYILFGLIPIYQAFQVRRNPMKIRYFRKLKALQPDAELDPRMQQFYFVNYLITGILWMLTGFIGWYFGMRLTYVMLVLAIIGGVAVYVAKWRIMGEVPKWPLVVLALAVVLMVVYPFWEYNSSEVLALDETFSIQGDYGTGMYYQSIDSVLVVNSLPNIMYCKDGYSILGSKKGYFRLKDGTDARFYILGKKAPYLEMYTCFGRIYVNRKTATETEQLIEELRDKIGDKMKGSVGLALPQ